ncbi:MAG TPA: MAB_1171c family putative transporter [Pseudonocardiaceae bacterium]|nr:MAB_1171c family putative transporter [Pseudonocardiaceae bacterium]
MPMSFAQLEMWGIACMGIVTVLRIPAIVRFPEQRGLWLVMAAATVSMSFHIKIVSDTVERFIGVSHWTDLFRHLCSLISVVWVLDFIIRVTGTRRLSRVLYPLAFAVGATLAALDTLAPPHARNNILKSDLSASWMTQSYWWILLDAHFWMNVAGTWACWRYSRPPAPPYLRAALRLFGLGLAFSAAYMGASMAYLAFRWPLAPALLPAFGAGEAVFMAAGTAVPLLLAIRVTGREALALYRLHPLWRVLVQAAPEVTFPGTVPRGRVRDLVSALPRVHTKLYRRIIEIRDALLVLSRYVTPEMTRQAREHVSNHPVPPALSEATFTACSVESARHARITGKIPSGAGSAISGHGGPNRDSEIRWLCSVAAAHRSPVIAAFTDTLRTGHRL